MPTRKLLVIFLIFSIGLIVISNFSGLSWLWLFIVNGIILGMSLIDLSFSPKRKEITGQRQIPSEMEKGITYTAHMKLSNASAYAVNVRLIDGVPQSFQAPFPLKGNINRQESAILSYNIVAPVRGEYEVNKMYIRYQSVFGLWEKQMAIELENMVKVIPDLTETKQYLKHAQRFLLYEGAKIRKQRDRTGEFTQIRNYVVGDDPRKINWRQTAKLQTLMANEYEPEHGKYITILIDCGRMMGAELRNGNRLEKSLEAALTTATAALKNGDYVAVLAFSKQVNVFVPPAKGMNHLQKIVQAIYNVNVDTNESNYPAAFAYVQNVQKKRSLILLFSDVHTFLQEETILIQLKRLRQQHLFMIIAVADETLLTTSKQEPMQVQQAMLKSMAQQQIQTKKREKVKWERQGLLLVETTEEHLATTAVSRYIDIMNQGLL
ncbi:DUF58 domain-containing protein [Virgibacillus sp. NKC19-3]|nr:DUF58 domain-containing protein [Virgibacillus sp. NKC19-3]